MTDLKYKLYAPMEIIIAVLSMWLLFASCEYIEGRPTRSSYVSCAIQMSRIIEIIRQSPQKYIGLSSKGVHSRIFQDFENECAFDEIKDARSDLCVGDNGFLLDPWGNEYEIDVREVPSDCRDDKCYVIRISSAGADGKFNAEGSGGDVVREEKISI